MPSITTKAKTRKSQLQQVPESEIGQAKIQRRELTSTCRGRGCAKWHSARTSALTRCSQPGRREGKEGGRAGWLPAARCPELILPSNGPFPKFGLQTFKHNSTWCLPRENSGLSSTSPAYQIINHCFQKLKIKKIGYWGMNSSDSKQENSRTVRLCLLLWKTTTVVGHFTHASPWLFTLPITKLFLGLCAPSSQLRVEDKSYSFITQFFLNK